MTASRHPVRRPRLLLLGHLLAAAAGAGEPGDGLFSEVAAEVGLDFVHWNGRTGQLYYSEVMGSGAALFDYDGDGDLDVYFVQGRLLAPGETVADAVVAPPQPPPIRDRLYRNDLAILPDGSRRLRFVDVTGESGIDARGYGMGVAAGDFDNDGRVDLYVTNLGPNQLWRNDGRGAGGAVTFSDVTAESGSDDPRWSTSVATLDFDRDGWLDLYVVNYLDFSAATHKPCRDATSAPNYCGSESYRGVPDRLLRNLGGEAGGDGAGPIRFEDVSLRSGIAGARKPGLGVVAADLDRDGWIDVYVADDADENLLWRNLGGDGRPGVFEEIGVIAGAAVNFEGRTEAGMGVGAGDFDGDGDFDLFLTHLTGETDTLYANLGGGGFEDVTIRSGLARPSRPFTSFGTGWIDVDNDGRLDLLAVSGAVQYLPEVGCRDRFDCLGQTSQLFRNLGAAASGPVRFEDASARAGPAFALAEVSRGAAFGDVDDDGDGDVLVTHNEGPARLLLNRGRAGNHWLGLRLAAGEPARDMIGAEVLVLRPGQAPLLRRVHTDGSYLSAGDPRVLVGLGPSPRPATVLVTWPDGSREEFAGVLADRYSTLRRGTGRAPAALVEIPSTAAAAMTAASPAAAEPAPVPASADLEPLPPADLGPLEPPVRLELEEARRNLAALLGGKTDPARLAAGFGELGRLHHAYRLLEAAAAAYRNAERLVPSRPDWPHLLGHVYLAAGEPRRAAASFRRALELDPGRTPARLWLARSLFESDQADAAAEILDRLLDAAPDLAAAHALRGQVALAMRDPAAAAAYLERALALQPDATVLHRALATAYAALGDAARSAGHLARRGDGTIAVRDPLLESLEELNRSSSLHLQRGQDAFVAGRFAEAAAAFRRSLALRPEDVTARVDLGSALARLGEVDAALAELRQALARDPRHAGAHFNLGVLSARRGETVTAIAEYRQAIASDPEHADARFNLANALRRLDRCAEALEHYRRVSAQDPARAPARRGEVLCLARLDRFAEALEKAEEGHRGLPGDLPLADALARLLAASPERGRRDGARALALARADFEAARTFDHVVTLAMAYAEAGSFEQAVDWQRQAIEVARRAGRPEVLALLQAGLEAYQRGETARRPWPEMPPGR